MNTEMTTYLVIGLILGIIVGIIFANIISPKARKYNQVKKELDETKKEIINQKQIIVKHFSHSAEILDNMAKDFRRLYQHMAENSSSLISEQDLQNTLYTAQNLGISNNEEQKEILITGAKPPKDYSGNPSGLLKTEDNKS